MLRLSISSFLCALLVTSTSFAAFSKFVVVSPDTENTHQELKPEIKNENGLVSVRIPYQESDKKYWLIVSDKQLQKENLNFRSLIWEGASARSDILLIAPLAPNAQPLTPKGKKPQLRDITLQLSSDLAQRAYIYHDFSDPVLDGGFFYTVDIPSYLNRRP
jgi:hypothetical protein